MGIELKESFDMWRNDGETKKKKMIEQFVKLLEDNLTPSSSVLIKINVYIIEQKR